MSEYINRVSYTEYFKRKSFKIVWRVQSTYHVKLWGKKRKDISYSGQMKYVDKELSFTILNKDCFD